MSIQDSFGIELNNEAANTRRLLASVPMEKADWKPHDKSMTLGALATHVAEIFTWISATLNYSELDFATFKYEPPKLTTQEELLAFFDDVVAQNTSVLSNTAESVFLENWTMRNGETVYFTLPKVAVVRTWVFNHLYHHRGQLTVYLRLLDIKVPGMFGPTADDATM